MRPLISSSAPFSSTDRPYRLLRDVAPEDRILSRADSEALFKRIAAMATGGGDTQVLIRGTWTANLRWGRNRPISAGNTVDRNIVITRYLKTVMVSAELGRLDDATLKRTMQALEQQVPALVPRESENNPEPTPLGPQKYPTTTTWSEATYKMSLGALSDTVRRSVDRVVDAKCVAAGYAELGATSWAVFNTRGLDAYATATGAMYRVAVRTPDGSGAGSASNAAIDWSKLDVSALSARALERCRNSANPYKIEPGRYTTILEASIVGTLMMGAVAMMDRESAEGNAGATPFSSQQTGKSKIGQRIFDERITLTSDPADPDCGYMPFTPRGHPYRKVTWVENGVLQELPYSYLYALHNHLSDGTIYLPNPQRFRISVSGPETSIDEMIATTERGLYVAGIGTMTLVDQKSMDYGTVTHHGVWLIEHGKIVHPVKNLWINDSPMVIFNQVLQVGRPVPTLGPQENGGFGGPSDTVLRGDISGRALLDGHMPVVVPPMKVRDFNFTRLSDAI